MVEFAYNNSYHVSIGMAPYEALYGRKCRSPLHWDEVGKRIALGSDVMQEAKEKVRIARQRLLTAQNQQKIYSNRRPRDLTFSAGNHVVLKGFVDPRSEAIRVVREAESPLHRTL